MTCARVALPVLSRLTQKFRPALSGVRRKKSTYCWVTKSTGSASGPVPPLVSKLAVTSTALLPAAMVQVPVPVHAPLQPANVLPLAAWATRVTTALLLTTGQERVQAGSQVTPGGVMVTLPVPLPALFRVKGRVVVLKLAVTSTALLPAAMVQVPVPVHAPLQPANVLPLAAWATRVMAVLMGKLATALLQSAAQFNTEGLLVTVPVPVPDLLNVTVRVTKVMVLKLAVTSTALLPAAMVQVPVPVQAPLQPANVLPLAAWATRVMVVLIGKLAAALLQLAAQFNNEGLLVTVPVPVPDLLSVTVRVAGVVVLKVAVTLRALPMLTLPAAALLVAPDNVPCSPDRPPTRAVPNPPRRAK